MQGKKPYRHRSYEITKTSQRAIIHIKLYLFKINKGNIKSESKIFQFNKKRRFR